MSDGAGDAVRVGREMFATSDPEAARDFIDRAYGCSTRLSGTFADDPLRYGRLDAGDLGGFSLDRVAMPADLGFTADPNARHMIGTGETGAWQVGNGREEVRPGAGEPLVIPQGVEYTVGVRRVDMQVVSLDPWLLHDAAGSPHDRRRQPVHFTSPVPVDPSGTELWRASTAFVAGQLARATTVAPLAVAGMARLLATTALAVFPSDAYVYAHTSAGAAAVDTTREASPESVRRAVAYIEAHADQDVAVADIAEAAGVTPRALQYAFRRHLGTTPLGHLRTVRLDLVHRDLLAAAPHSGRTVTQVAGRWGFWHPGRFAAQYREVYGCSPSETLNREV